jgi:hypothetical protein
MWPALCSTDGVRHRHRFGLVLCCNVAACASNVAGSGADGEPAATTEPVKPGQQKLVTLPHTSSFVFETGNLSHYWKIPAGGSVTVSVHAAWDRPGACKVPNYTVTLRRRGILTATEIGTLTAPTDGTTHSETWTSLQAGEYELYLYVANTNEHCNLVGSLTIR